MTERRRWQGERPTACDLCGARLVDVFVDGKTRGGPWGILCRGCHEARGVGLGTGRGQRYDLATGRKLEG